MEFLSEIYYTGYVIIIGDYYTPSQLVGIIVEDIRHILFFLSYSKLQSAV